MFGTGVFSVEQPRDEEDGSFGSEDLNELEVNGNWTPQEKALHEAKLKAKAKRRLRKSSSRDSTRESLSDSVSGELSTDPHSPKGKNAVNDRKSRTGKGRGLPKKGEILKLTFSVHYSVLRLIIYYYNTLLLFIKIHGFL